MPLKTGPFATASAENKWTQVSQQISFYTAVAQMSKANQYWSNEYQKWQNEETALHIKGAFQALVSDEVEVSIYSEMKINAPVKNFFDKIAAAKEVQQYKIKYAQEKAANAAKQLAITQKWLQEAAEFEEKMRHWLDQDFGPSDN